MKKLRAYWSQGMPAAIHSRFSNSTKIKIYRTIIFACCFVWVWNLVTTLREEHKPRVFENRVLRKIFGPKRDGIMRGVEKTTWREALWSLLLTKCYSGDKSGSMRWTGHIARIGDRRGAYRGLVGRSEGYKPFGRLKADWRIILKWVLWMR